MDSSSSHILIITSWYPTPENPLYGSFVEEQANLLARNHHKVTVVHIFLKGRFMQTLMSRSTDVTTTQSDLLTVHTIGVAPVFPRARSANYRKAAKFLMGFLESKKLITPETIIHSHSAFIGGVVASKVAKQFKCDFFHTEHSSGIILNPEEYTTEDRKALKELLSTASTSIFVSRFARDKVNKEYGLTTKKQKVIPNLVDNHFFERPLESSHQNGFTILSIGALSDLKNQELLLKTVHLLKNQINGLKVIIAGEGPKKEELISLCNSLDIDEQVSFIGRLDRKEVAEQLSRADLHVSTSKIETFGLTIAESIALGTPVLACDSGGVNDIITNECGMICEYSTESLAQGILHFLDNRDKYPAQKKRKKER